MEWLLIFAIYTGPYNESGVSTNSIKFKSLKACEIARVQIEDFKYRSTIKSVCVEGGR